MAEQIIDGPDRAMFGSKFILREPIVIRTTFGERTIIISKLEHEDGSGNSFNFETTTGVSGNYNTKRQKGSINL